MKAGYTYIMSNRNRSTLYIGLTNDIHRRVWEHKRGKSNFTSRYRLFELVYYEEFPAITDAIAREKQLKNWHRDWKWNLIKQANPELKDLACQWYTVEQLTTP